MNINCFLFPIYLAESGNVCPSVLVGGVEADILMISPLWRESCSRLIGSV